jgi:hypothetical protein
MAKTNIKVSFIRTTKTKYSEYEAAGSIVDGAIYFVQDTEEGQGKIYMDNTIYGKSYSIPTNYAFETVDGKTNLVVTFDDGNEEKYEVPVKEGVTYTAGDGIIISDDNVISADMDYISENAKVKTAITVTENVGGYSAGDTVAADTKILDVLQKMLCEEKQPTITQPTIRISSTSPNASGTGSTVYVEAGTKLSPTITVELTSNGSYEYGPTNTGVSVTKYYFSMSDPTDTSYPKTSDPWVDETITSSRLSYSYTFPEHTVDEFTKQNQWAMWGGLAWSEGVDALTNLGNTAANKIKASSTNQVIYVKGVRYAFYGSLVTPLTELNSAAIRGLNGVSTQGLTTLSVPITEGSKQVIIAVPSGKTVTSVLDKNLSNSEVVDTFTVSTVSVEGANGYTAKDYNVYVYNSNTLLGENTYTVTIK